MSCISSPYKTEYEAKIVKLQSQLDLANDTLDELTSAEVGGIDSYKFDSNEGSQQTRRRKLKELQELISWLEARIDWYRRKLQCGGGLVAINTRRI